MEQGPEGIEWAVPLLLGEEVGGCCVLDRGSEMNLGAQARMLGRRSMQKGLGCMARGRGTAARLLGRSRVLGRLTSSRIKR